MINNFIGGGQVFLHKVRMFRQVLSKTFWASIILSSIITSFVYRADIKEIDMLAFISYRKAIIINSLDDFANDIRSTIGKSPDYVTYIKANSSKSGSWGQRLKPSWVINANYFKKANTKAMDLAIHMLIIGGIIAFVIFVLIFIIWSKVGKNLKSEKSKDGSPTVLTAKEVRKILSRNNQESLLRIGDISLVKDSETRHFIVTGSTGSGKTNFFHNLLPQVESQNRPAIVIDQTGEMIAKYYNQNRGDIIFNPFDARGKRWDFWTDCSSEEEIERFSKILFSFNRKKSGSNNDPFWEQSAETVFNACVGYQKTQSPSIEQLTHLVRHSSREELKMKLQNTDAGRYFDKDNKTTACSILSVLSTITKPLKCLKDANTDNSFSLKKYFQNIDNGAWLFLSSKPSSREITQALTACLVELSFNLLLDIGIKEDRRLWFVIDELAALGKLPALSTIMAEGRKYGACVLSGLQSLNQLYSNYGHYEGSTIFGQFGTNVFFQNTEQEIAKMVTSMSGTETVFRQQKNTSFGAHEFRDGVSYNEHQQRKSLIEYNDLSSLSIGECFMFLPEPKVRLSKMKIPKAKVTDKNPGFLQIQDTENNNIPLETQKKPDLVDREDTGTLALEKTENEPVQDKEFDIKIENINNKT